jgi:hypothetical protein
MPTDEEIDRSLVEFAQKIAAIPKRIADEGRSAESSAEAAPAVSPASSEIGCESLPPPLPAGKQPDPDIRPAPLVDAGAKQVRNPDEIASLIMKSLRTIDGCPNRGFVVTVYGSNPWNAMLTIRPEAGPRIDRELWRSRVHDIGVHLRNDYDVADTSTISSSSST